MNRGRNPYLSVAWLRSLGLCLCLAGVGIYSPGFAAIAPEVFVPLGDLSGARSIAWAPDGRAVAAGYANGNVGVWDVSDGRLLRPLAAHTGPVLALAFTADGRTLVSVGADGAIRVWDLGTGQTVRSFQRRGTALQAVAISPDGRRVAIAAPSGDTELWDLQTTRPLLLAAGDGLSAGNIRALAFSSDGARLAAAGAGTAILIWELRTSRTPRALTVTGSPIQALAFSLDQSQLAAGMADGRVMLWLLRDGSQTLVLRGYPSAIRALAFRPQATVLAVSAEDRSIHTWSTVTGRSMEKLEFRTELGTALAYSPTGEALAIGNESGPIELWHPPDGIRTQTLAGTRQPGRAMALSATGAMLVTSDAAGRIWFHDTSTGRPLNMLRANGVQVNAVALTVNSPLIPVVSDEGGVKIWNMFNKEVAHSYLKPGVANLDAKLSSNDRMLAVRNVRGFVDIYDLHTLDRTLTLTWRQVEFRDMAWAPDNHTLATGAADGMIQLWDGTTAMELQRFTNGHQGPVTAVTFAPDGHLLASADAGGGIRLWDPGSGRIVTRFEQPGGVSAMAFAPDGKLLATASDRGPIRLRDPATGREVAMLGAAGGLRLQFSADGRTLAVQAADRTVHLWDMSTRSERARFLVFDDGSLLTITPEGYYDYSGDSAEDHLLVRFGENLFDVSSIGDYRDQFYRPDLVRRALAGQHALKGLPSLDQIKPAPVVTLLDVPAQVEGDTVSLHALLTDRGGGVGVVRVFVNGTAVADSGRRGIAVKGTAVAQAGTRDIQVRLPRGENRLEVFAYNTDGSMRSAAATATIRASYRRAEGPVLHALLVGIDQFRNPSLSLRYSVADAEAVAAVLRRQGEALFSSVQIELLTTPEQTTKAALAAAFARYHGVAPDDVFLFFVASHGTVDEQDDIHHEYYLITSNVGPTDADALRSEAVSQEELQRWLASIPATKKLLLLDTCQSGALGDALALKARGMDDQRAVNILGRAVGSTVLSAATSQQSALEGIDGHGVFTWVVLAGLAGKADSRNNGFVSTLDLATYVSDEVPRIARQRFQRDQFPNLHSAGQSFPIVSSH